MVPFQLQEIKCRKIASIKRNNYIIYNLTFDNKRIVRQLEHDNAAKIIKRENLDYHMLEMSHTNNMFNIIYYFSKFKADMKNTHSVKLITAIFEAFYQNKKRINCIVTSFNYRRNFLLFLIISFLYSRL